MHQRATRMADTDLTTPGVFDEHDECFYDAAWRLLEERRFGESAFTGQAEEIVQRLWGLTYIDEFLGELRDRTWSDGGVPTPPDGDMTTGSVGRHYAVCDRRHDVVALLNPSGNPVERVRYTAYGVAQVRKPADMADGAPGSVDGADQGRLLGLWGTEYRTHASYNPEADLNLDGTIDGADLGSLTGAWGAYDAAEGKVSTVGNTIAYAGYVYDAAVDLYVVRFRWYDARDGRWVTRDPFECIDGNGLYVYASVSPIVSSDPFGLDPKWSLAVARAIASGDAGLVQALIPGISRQAAIALISATMGTVVIVSSPEEVRNLAEEMADAVEAIAQGIGGAADAASEVVKATREAIKRAVQEIAAQVKKNRKPQKNTPCDIVRAAIAAESSGITGLGKQIEKHKKWIENPRKYPDKCPPDASPEEIENRRNKWKRDIGRQGREIEKKRKVIDRLRKIERVVCKNTFRGNPHTFTP